MENETNKTMEAVVAIVVRHRKTIESYANAIIRDLHLAEDVYQEVAIVVAKKWSALPADEKLVPWLMETTRRKSLEMLRSRRRAPITLAESTFDMLVEEFAAEETRAEPDERAQRRYAILRQCLDKLHPTARRVMDMRYGEERPRPFEEIAATLGRSVKAVYNIMGRSRLSVAHCVEQTEKEMPSI